MSERLHRPLKKESVEEEPAPPEVLPKSVPGGEGKRERPSPLEMLFREAEVIARNLRESGTRR